MRPALVAILAVGCLLAAAGGSAAQTGGGGAVYVAKPKVSKVKCVRRCASRKRARADSVLRITGSDLHGATGVTFLGSYGKGDDVPARARAASNSRLNVRVPLDAVTGPISVASGSLRGRPSKTVTILPPPPPDPNPTLTPVPGPRDSGAPRLETGTSRVRAFLGARRIVVFSWRITGAVPASVRVELVRARDGMTVLTWTPPAAPSGTVQSATWNGNLGTGAAGPGRYAFRLTAAGASGASARSAQAPNFSRDAFDLYENFFPVRGRHDYGGGGAQFGAGRGGRRHQGHDLFARCGTRMVAARGGTVKTKAYHRAAGNYVVIDGVGTPIDYVYMHMAEPTPFEEGDRVFTGQRIGAVGETGNARGCHLHFELWGAPGWYGGGRPFDPEPSLRAWDSWS